MNIIVLHRERNVKTTLDNVKKAVLLVQDKDGHIYSIGVGPGYDVIVRK